MRPWGFAIPGLAMQAGELPALPGLVRLENPEIGDGARLDTDYGLETVADIHLKTILSHAPSDPFIVMGMSMGGMIASVLASVMRSKLPTRARFAFLVTSPNLIDQPAISDSTLANWMTVRPGSVDDFERILADFFSPSFRQSRPRDCASYYAYRASNGNRQDSRALMRQIVAVRNFNGRDYFSRVDGNECYFVHGESDLILSAPHAKSLESLAPDARHDWVGRLGHMINIERPELFDLREAAHVQV